MREKDETLPMIIQDIKSDESNLWYVDTRCNNHLSGSKSSFSFLNENLEIVLNHGQ